MKKNRSFVFLVVLSFLARTLSICLAFGCLVVGCGINLNEFKTQEEKLKPLKERRAPKEEVTRMLGSDFLMYSRESTNWAHLTNYLAIEPPNRNVAVRECVARWPRAMLYSTPDMMTWVFLDKDEKVTDFVVGAQ